MPIIRQQEPLLDGDPARRNLLLDGTQIPAHRHRQGQLLYPSAGVLTTITELGTWIAPANRIAWTPPGFLHGHRVYGETDVRILEVPGEMCGSLPTQPTVFGVSALLREGLLALTDGQARPIEARDRLRHVVLDELCGVPNEIALHLREPADDRLKAITDLMHANPGNSSSLSELGHTVGASDRTLSRLFHTELGMSFQKWRTLLRIQHALVYLTDGRSVTDIATLCGWSNPSSFIDAFTAILGQTPGRYMREAQSSQSV